MKKTSRVKKPVEKVIKTGIPHTPPSIHYQPISMQRNFYKAHPWHGIQIGDEMPKIVTAFIEIVSTDTVKYEIDKETGYLKIDRPQNSLTSFLPFTVSFLKLIVEKSQHSLLVSNQEKLSKPVMVTH
jgi:inorganic pyrophosphatase